MRCQGGGNAFALHRVKRGLDRASATGRSERRGGAPKGERVPLNARPRPKRRGMATSDAWRGPTGQSRLFGAPPPFIILRRNNSWLWSANLGRTCVARTRGRAPSAPAKRGRGTTGAREASEPWWRGAGLKASLSSENYRSLAAEISLNRLWRVESCAPSTTLLRRVVPLPRYRGAG